MSQRFLRAVVTLLRLCLVALVLVPVYAFVGSHEGAAGRILVAGFVVVAAVTPGNALLVCAGLLVLAGPLGLLVPSPFALSEPLALAFLGGWLLHVTIRPGSKAEASVRAMLAPALVFAAVAAASVLVRLAVRGASLDYPWRFAGTVLAFLGSDYLADARRFPSLTAGSVLLEAIGLFVAALTLARRHPGLGRRIAAMAVAGAAGVATLNVTRFVVFYLGSHEPIAASLGRVRVSSVFPDVNAAGSYLAMLFCLALGLSAAGRRGARAAWAGAAALILAALGITGSRSAFVGVALGALALAWPALPGWRLAPRATRAAVVAGSLALVVLAGAWLLYPSGKTARDPSIAYQWRVEMAQAALRISSEHPVFGVGVGRFWEVSDDYIDPDFGQRVVAEWGRPSPFRENAHNNYLQVLAELGLAGLLAWLWTLAAVGRRGWPAAAGDQVLAGALAGLFAFLVTCLAGHPLLIRDVAFAFWLVLGVAAALSIEDARRPADSRGPVPNRRRRIEGGEAPGGQAATSENTGIFGQGATQPEGMHRRRTAGVTGNRAPGPAELM